jgi:hypothetical protein
VRSDRCTQEYGLKLSFLGLVVCFNHGLSSVHVVYSLLAYIAEANKVLEESVLSFKSLCRSLKSSLAGRLLLETNLLLSGFPVVIPRILKREYLD